MTGTDANSGKALSGLAHLRQSIIDILTTPIGTRVMRRDYGSRCFEFLDAPTSRQTIVEIYAAAAEALLKWEPRIKVQKIIADAITPGSIQLTISGIYVPEGNPVAIDGVIVA